MSKTERIKWVSLCTIMDKLWIEYKATGKWEYRIYENGTLTDWRTFHDEPNKRLVYDHSWKWRPAWDQFWFVKDYLKINDKQTFEWFCENLDICDDAVPVMQLWQQLAPFNQDVIDYLRSRWIDYQNVSDVVKVMNWWPACLIWSWWRPKSICSRRIDVEKKNRFLTLAGTSNTWLYKWDLDTEKDYLFVVEGMMDFLTIRQYDKNVVWLHNCDNGFDDVVKLSEWFDIIFIPDNDAAWDASRKHLESIPHKVVNISQFEQEWERIKDINDLHAVIVGTKDNQFSDMFIELLLENAQFEAPIKSVFSKLKAMREIIKERWMLWRPWPIKEIFDDTCSGMIEGKVYTIAAFSNTGKSKLGYHFCWYCVEQKLKTLFINLEVSEEMCLGNIIARVEHQPFLSVMSEYKYKESLYNKLIIKDNIIRIDLIEDYVRQVMPDVLFIDFVQNIEWKWEWYEKNATIAKRIQRLAIETWTTIFSLSQLPNDAVAKIKAWLYDEVVPKWAWEYFASSDVIFLLHWEELANGERKIILTISKNKFWPNGSQHVLSPNWQTNDFVYEWPLNDGFVLKEKKKF